MDYRYFVSQKPVMTVISQSKRTYGVDKIIISQNRRFMVIFIEIIYALTLYEWLHSLLPFLCPRQAYFFQTTEP